MSPIQPKVYKFIAAAIVKGAARHKKKMSVEYFMGKVVSPHSTASSDLTPGGRDENKHVMIESQKENDQIYFRFGLFRDDTSGFWARNLQQIRFGDWEILPGKYAVRCHAYLIKGNEPIRSSETYRTDLEIFLPK
jgi:hypothetical protein